MQIIVHRGTHQIGGVATEIRTEKTRILIDMGDELGDNASPAPLSIPGVTDAKGDCAAVLLTHNHIDHTGQLKRLREGIPLYMGSLAKAVFLASLPKEDGALRRRVEEAKTFSPGESFWIGGLRITPFLVDHSACDSYMFLVEGEGKGVLHTGDFRLHGFRGKAIPKILGPLAGKVDLLILEGTTLSRADRKPAAEGELQQRARGYMARYKYVFVLCAATNLERICGMSKAVPRGRYFICDEYQGRLLDLVGRHWGGFSPLYRDMKKTLYGENLLPRFREKGFMMMVRDNRKFREIVRRFDPKESIILYSMWDGYRTRPGSTIQSFLDLAGRWEPLHTSGHASRRDLQAVIEALKPDRILPIHTDCPGMIQTLCPDSRVLLLEDGETVCL